MIALQEGCDYRVLVTTTSAQEHQIRTSLSAGAQVVDPLDQQHEFLHRIATRMVSTVPFDQVLTELVDFIDSVVPCDSCFVYVMEGDALLLRASKNPHPEALNRLKLKVGQGITGWVAQHREPVAIPRGAAVDARFQFFNELPEDRFEAFLSVPLLSRGRVVGVLNLQNRAPHVYTEREILLMSTVGFLVGAEIELACLEREKSELVGQFQSWKVVERAKGILQRTLKVSEPAAHAMLQRQSQQRRRPMKEIAEAIVLSHSVTHDRRT